MQDGSELRIRRVAVLDRELGRVGVTGVSHEVDERHERDDDAEEVGPLRQGGAGEKPAVALADEAEPVARR